jgi:chromate transport protein ChrA
LIGTFFVFLPSFVLVLAGVRYAECIQESRSFQAFLAGASTAIVGILLAVLLDLTPAALVSERSAALGCISFLLIVLFKVEVAFVTVGALLLGVVYALSQVYS